METIPIECDYTMTKHLLRVWGNNRLRPQGFRLAVIRPRLIATQGGICPDCGKLADHYPCENKEDVKFGDPN